MQRVSVESLLRILASHVKGGIERLAYQYGVRARGQAAMCEALALEYGDDYARFFQDCRRDDLLGLFDSLRESIYLPREKSYRRDELIEFATLLFVEGVIPGEFVSLEDDDDDDDEDEEADDEDFEGSEDFDVEEDVEDIASSSGERGARLRDMRYSPDEAAKPLHPYQEDAVRVLRRALGSGEPKLLHLATGGGKTRVANTLARQWLDERGGPVLWVTKDWRLLEQAALDFGQRNQGANLSR